MITRTQYIVSCWLLMAFVLGCLGCHTTENQNDWPEYLGGPDRNHYSKLDQITTHNVVQLTKAWEFHTGDSGEIQCNPIIVDGVLYGVTAKNQPFALDAATGTELWRYSIPTVSSFNINRGVSYWEGNGEKRILVGHAASLYALDAVTGKSIVTFGDSGRISLREGLGANAQDKFVVSTTPGTVFENLIIMPLRLSEGADAAPGNIQAFDVITGKLVWVFHTIPHPGEDGYETWPEHAYKNTEVGAANSWAGMSVDKERGILFVPTGSAGFDFYGGNRKGQNLYANSLVALDVRTGKKLWHYQIVHHDIWDRDLPAPPNLVTIKKEGRQIDAVAQVTKSGRIFVFERETGIPVFPIDEVPVPESDMPGEEAWPTQPVPQLPVPFSRQTMTEADINPYSADKDSLLTVFKNARKDHYMPLSFTPTILFPGCDGGAEWGGAAVDPSGIMYVNANEMAWIFTLSHNLKDKDLDGMTYGRKTYMQYCSSCHGNELKGNPASGYPSLKDVKSKLSKKVVSTIITGGKGMMPGFTSINAEQKQALIAYLFDEEKSEATPTVQNEKKKPYVPYKFDGYKKFLDSEGLPAISPPWGTLTAIDLNTGQKVWQEVLGETLSLKEKGIEKTGTENYGGPLITAGGVLFIAATKDEKFRAFEKKTGKVLWETTLPASGFATPSTFQVKGKQYVVIACGGTKLGAKKGDSYVAFALE